MSFRWSKTISAYNQWAYIFDKTLPCEITTKQSALTATTYIRDVIEFAYLNNIKGNDWYKAVNVSATSNHTIAISSKKKMPLSATRIMADSFITRSVFDLLELNQDKKLLIGMKFYSAEDFDDLADTMQSVGVTIRQCVEETEKGIYEIMTNGFQEVVEEISEGFRLSDAVPQEDTPQEDAPREDIPREDAPETETKQSILNLLGDKD
jgi:hypothetical protein